MDEIIRKAAGGDQESLARLVRLHYEAVCRFCMRRLGPDLGQDAAQETFVLMQKRLPSYRGEARFSTWLLGIAHNQVRATARKRRREALPLEDWFPAPGPNPEEQGSDRAALHSALSALTSEHREVVLMHEVEGLTYAEIAGIIGVPEGTVKSRLHHAFARLRTAMNGGSK
ncbi:MAG: sigma-70 family RNA polymerase sigma factor [Fimbriimonadaceae bacterium]|nr:sigma-70 family RNA polymerase sigma factor [Fimbriimonadaceae bacterium]